MEGVLAIAGVVGRIGEKISVITRRKAADRHELLALGHLVQVEEDLLWCVDRSLLAAIDRILLSFLRARVIKIVAPAIRDAHVSLFDVAENLVVKLVLHRLSRL